MNQSGLSLYKLGTSLSKHRLLREVYLFESEPQSRRTEQGRSVRNDMSGKL